MVILAVCFRNVQFFRFMLLNDQKRSVLHVPEAFKLQLLQLYLVAANYHDDENC